MTDPSCLADEGGETGPAVRAALLSCRLAAGDAPLMSQSRPGEGRLCRLL
ncbi:hypothetical protein VWZ88_10210 [Phaeobacter sp. JH20_36]